VQGAENQAKTESWSPKENIPPCNNPESGHAPLSPVGGGECALAPTSAFVCASVPKGNQWGHRKDQQCTTRLKGITFELQPLVGGSGFTSRICKRHKSIGPMTGGKVGWCIKGRTRDNLQRKSEKGAAFTLPSEIGGRKR